jgi:hypothetical protein
MIASDNIGWRPFTPAMLERGAVIGRDYLLLPLARAWKAGALRSVILAGTDFWPPARIYDPSVTPGPAVLLVRGDGVDAFGPSAMPHAPRAFKWATRVVIHAAGGEPWHYQGVAEAAAETGGRILLIETCTRHRDAWIAAAHRHASPLAGLIIDVPPDGPPHPLAQPAH